MDSPQEREHLRYSAIVPDKPASLPLRPHHGMRIPYPRGHFEINDIIMYQVEQMFGTCGAQFVHYYSHPAIISSHLFSVYSIKSQKSTDRT